MKNITISLVFAIAGIMSVSCVEMEEKSSRGYQGEITKVTMEAQGFVDESTLLGTKTSFVYTQGYGTVFSWAAKDTVGIFPDEGDQVNFAISEGVGTSTCVFDGGGWGLKGNSKYMAYYPFNRNNYISMGKKKDIRLSYIGESQEAKDKIDLGQYDYMAATASAPTGSTDNFQFTHLNTLVVLDVTFPKEGIFTQLDLTTSSNKFVTEGSIDLTKESISITPISTSNKMSLKLGSINITAGETVRFFMLVAPTDLTSETVTLTASTIDNTQFSSVVTSKNFKPGYTSRLEANLTQNGVREVTLKSAGTLKSLLGSNYLDITNLKVSGPLNGDDILTIRNMLGRDVSDDGTTAGRLTSLDMSGANIVEGGSNYYNGAYGHPNTSSNTIGDWMFINCKNLETISLPSSITSIGTGAFWNCPALQSICIPKEVSTIGGGAFNNCTALSSIILPKALNNIVDNYNYDRTFEKCNSLKVIYNYSGLSLTLGSDSYGYIARNAKKIYNLSGSTTSEEISGFLFSTINEVPTLLGYNGKETDIILPADYKGNKYNVGDYAFYNRSDLKKITLSSGITEIGNFSFYGCSNIKFINIPNSVTKVGTSAFQSCTQLHSLYVGNSVIYLGDKAFAYCSTLYKVFMLPNSIPNTGVSGGISSSFTEVPGRQTYVSSSSYDSYTVLGTKNIYTNLSSYFDVGDIIYVLKSPSDRTCVAVDCDYNGTDTDIKIPSKVSYLGIDLSVTTVSDYTGYDNDRFSSLNISLPGAIGTSAFQYCDNLSKVTLSNQGSISSYAFASCPKINTAIITTKGDIKDNAFRSSSTTSPATYDIDNVGLIGISAFQNSTKMSHLTIGSNVTSIGSSAFAGCTEISYAHIRNNGMIGVGAFSGSSGTDATYDIDNNGSIEANAFSGCAKIAELKIGSSVSNISESAFAGCSTVSGCNAKYTINNTGTIGTSAFANCTQLVTVILGDNIPSLADKSFYGCSSLSDLTLGSKLATIGNSAFEKCSSLPSISLSDVVTSLGNRAFEECTSLKTAVIGNILPKIDYETFMGCSALESINFGSSVATIGDSALKNCSALASISIPNNVNSIGNFVFNGCIRLANVTIQDGPNNLVLGYNTKSSGSTVLGYGMFYDCPLNSVYLGRPHTYETALQYGYSPFYRNTHLTTVNIGDPVPTVFENEFYGCTSLKTVDIGEGTTSVGNYAFSGDTSLDLFEIGSNVATIGQEAFSDCSAMTKFTSHRAAPPTLGSQALDDINKWVCHLWVPTESVSAYAAADQWKEFLFVNK